jgi:hypothetical protein
VAISVHLGQCWSPEHQKTEEGHLLDLSKPRMTTQLRLSQAGEGRHE